jgi:predicted MFS family arabinose efflux permease
MLKISDLVTQFKSYKKLIGNSRLMRVILAGFISSMGSKISYFALLIKVYGLSDGKIQNLGFLSITEMIPFMLFGSLAGVVVDKISRKKIMILSDVLNAMITLSIIFIQDMRLIYCTAFLASFVNVFRFPAQRSMEPNLVDREDIPLMNSFGSAANNLIHIIGSAVGAAVVGFTGVRSSFIIDAISFIASASIILTVSINETHMEKNEDKNGEKGNFKAQFKEGLTILIRNRGLRLMAIIDIYMTFAMAMQGTLIYIFLIEALKMSKEEASKGWGILLSSLGIGALLGSMIIGILVKKYKNRFKLFLNILIFVAAFFIAFVINSYFPLSIGIFAFLGCIGTAHNIILNTVIQDTVSDENRGKVFGIISTLNSPVGILSIFVGTTAAQFITAKYVLLISVGLELLIAVGTRFTPSYREFEASTIKTDSQKAAIQE